MNLKGKNMQPTWRWYGPNDVITLSEIRQTGATGIVTALHEVPNGTVWSIDDINARRELIERAGLKWSVIESMPVPEAIKQGLNERDNLIDNFCQTLRNLATCGLTRVCYNFMPLLDWSRTDLAFPLPEGGLALRFEHIDFAAFDLFILKRGNAEQDYSDAEIAAAKYRFETLNESSKQQLLNNLIAGLPGADEHYDIERFRSTLGDYANIDRDRLRENLRYFLAAVVPVAEQCGIKLAIHPDDPPFPLLGLPRIVSTADDARWLLNALPSPANGLTFCTGSYGVRADNDLVAMVREFGENIHFVHLRSTRREDDHVGGSFHEAAHLDGDVDMVAVIQALIEQEDSQQAKGEGLLPMRPDHGHSLLDDNARQTAPGYPLYGRMRGLAELRGVEMAVRKLARRPINY